MGNQPSAAATTSNASDGIVAENDTHTRSTTTTTSNEQATHAHRDRYYSNKHKHKQLEPRQHYNTNAYNINSNELDAVMRNGRPHHAPHQQYERTYDYTLPTEEKPSVDMFFPVLRVLGKGSFGKVVLVQKRTGVDSGSLFALKILRKQHLLKKRQVERTKTERKVLTVTNHPFIMKLHFAFQTHDRLFFVLDYCPGGELFFHLSRFRRFPERVARFYTAELLLAIGHLHGFGIAYRDLKPENVLLDAQGHVKLGDFGLAKENIWDPCQGAKSLCGTPEYMAPEVLRQIGHGLTVDYWGLGMVTYEMMTGLPPWYTTDRNKLFKRIKRAQLIIPDFFSESAADLCSWLLERNPYHRLGVGGVQTVMAHPFFRKLNWRNVENRQLIPPIRPCEGWRAPGSDANYNIQIDPDGQVRATGDASIWHEEDLDEMVSNFDFEITRGPIDTLDDGDGTSAVSEYSVNSPQHQQQMQQQRYKHFNEQLSDSGLSDQEQDLIKKYPGFSYHKDEAHFAANQGSMQHIYQPRVPQQQQDYSAHYYQHQNHSHAHAAHHAAHLPAGAYASPPLSPQAQAAAHHAYNVAAAYPQQQQQLYTAAANATNGGVVYSPTHNGIPHHPQSPPSYNAHAHPNGNVYSPNSYNGSHQYANANGNHNNYAVQYNPHQGHSNGNSNQNGHHSQHHRRSNFDIPPLSPTQYNHLQPQPQQQQQQQQQQYHYAKQNQQQYQQNQTSEQSQYSNGYPETSSINSKNSNNVASNQNIEGVVQEIKDLSLDDEEKRWDDKWDQDVTGSDAEDADEDEEDINASEHDDVPLAGEDLAIPSTPSSNVNVNSNANAKLPPSVPKAQVSTTTSTEFSALDAAVAVVEQHNNNKGKGAPLSISPSSSLIHAHRKVSGASRDGTIHSLHSSDDSCCSSKRRI